MCSGGFAMWSWRLRQLWVLGLVLRGAVDLGSNFQACPKVSGRGKSECDPACPRELSPALIHGMWRDLHLH
jgi:hypothetical protein